MYDPVVYGLAAYENESGSFVIAFFFCEQHLVLSVLGQYMMSFVFASVILHTGSILPDSYSLAVAMETVTSWAVI
jgi:hypothetical protein